MRFLLKTILLALFCAAAHADVQPGLWYDPARPGSGISLHRSGETFFASVFEYDADLRPAWYFASNVVFDGAILDPGGPIFAGKLYRGTGTPLQSPQHQFTYVEVGRISMWQFRDTLTVNITFAPACPTCEQRVVGRFFVRLM